MLDAKAITSRRAVYAQCIADAGECLMKARSNGKEKEVAKLQDRIWLLMWAREILCNYALPGETPDAQLCSTDKDVRCAMRLADPGCVKCGCQGFVSNPIPAPPPCDIKYDIYVRDTVDASEYTPTVGLKPQLIISNVNSVTNEWSGHVGEVVQEPNFSTVPIGSVVYSQIGATFWIQTPAGIGAYFPGLTAEQVDSTHITVTSAWPNVNDYQGYNIVIEAMVNGVWVPLYSGTDNLVTPQTYDIEAPATSVRYTYMTKDCKYGPYTAGTLSDPPIPVCGVPDLEYNWVSVGGGLQNLEVTMNTSADFTPGEMYVEQDDTPTSPQTFGALPDTLTFGPFSAGEVTVHLVNLITDCPPYVENIGVPFVCAGEGTISVVATDSWYSVVFTDTEYYSVRKDGNSPTTYPSGTSTHDLADGSFCVYPSNSGGLQTGHITGYGLYGNGTDPVTSIEVDVSRLSGLTSVADIGFSTNTTIVFSGIENVFDIYAHDLPNITTLDISLSVSANFIIVKNNPLQTDLTFSPLSQCLYFDGRGCAFTQSVIDAILVEIAANGLAATVELSGGTNAAPSATGLAAKSTIISNGGNVTNN